MLKSNPFFLFLFILIIFSSFLTPTFAYHLGEGVHHPTPPSISYMTPNDQVFVGIKSENVECKPGLELHLKINGNPICIKESTFEKLIERGYPFSEKNSNLHPIQNNVIDDERELYERVLQYCENPPYPDSHVIVTYSNGTHFIDTQDCVWKKL
jgi:hypothetical protein